MTPSIIRVTLLALGLLLLPIAARHAGLGPGHDHP